MLCWDSKRSCIMHLSDRDPISPWDGEETRVDRTRRHCSVETIRGTGPSELGWSWPMSKNPLERAWPQWDQRRLSNRREQILHFDLSRKGREAITFISCHTSLHSRCPDTYCLHFEVKKTKKRTSKCRDIGSFVFERRTRRVAYYNLPRGKWSTLISTLSCCDDENVRFGGNTGLPEQHFSIKHHQNEKISLSGCSIPYRSFVENSRIIMIETHMVFRWWFSR